jgi:transcription antitermination factor NusG
VSALFPGYCFIHVEQLGCDTSRLPSVIKPVMSGDEPAHVPDGIIAEIRSRKRNGFVEPPKKRLQPGESVKIISGLLAGRRGRYAGASHRHIKVLLQLLGAERQVQVSPTPSSSARQLRPPPAVALVKRDRVDYQVQFTDAD